MAACLLMTACAAPKVVRDYQRDSVVVIRDSVRFRDSLVLVPVPQGSDKAVLPDSDTSRLETDIAESVAYVADGKLHMLSAIRMRLSFPSRSSCRNAFIMRHGIKLYITG